MYNRNEKYSTREAFGKKLAELGKNENLVVFDADLSKSTKIDIFAKEFPDRFFDVGVAEANMISTAIGAASEGMIPVTNTFAVFSGRSLDQIYQGLRGKYHIIFHFSHSGFVGEDGPSHHGICAATYLSAVPGMKAVLKPCDAIETEKILEWAIKENKEAVSILTDRDKTPIFMPDNYKFELGKAYEVSMEGNPDIIIFATSPYMIRNSLEAREILKKYDINTGIINMPTIKPLNEKEILKYAKNVKAIVTAECSSLRGGLGSAIGRILGEYGIRHKIIGVDENDYGESDKIENLIKHAGLDAESIADKIEAFYKKAK